MKKYMDRFRSNANETEEMVDAVVRFMPLRSLRSFLQITNEEIDSIVTDLKEHVEKQLQK